MANWGRRAVMRKRIVYVCMGILLLLAFLLQLWPSRKPPENFVAEAPPCVAAPLRHTKHTEASPTSPSVTQSLDPCEILEEAGPPTVTLQGIVTNRRLRPIEGAEVSRHGHEKEPDAITDGQGRFEIPELPADTELLYFRHPDYSPKRVPIISEVQSEELLEVVLDKGATLTGTVTHLGRPVASQQVIVTAKVMISTTTKSARTDTFGVYEIAHLEPGRQTARVLLQSDDNEVPSRKLSVDVVLEDEATTVANFNFREWDASLEGQVLFNGDPFQGAYVNVTGRTPDSARESFSEKVDANGHYHFEALPSGVLDVSVGGTYKGTTSYRGPTTAIEIPAGFVTTKDFSLGGSGVVTGYCLGLKKYDGADTEVMLLTPDISALLDEGGWAEMGVTLNRGSSPASCRKIAEDGSFLIQGLEPGDYTILVLALPHTLSITHVSYAYASVTVSDSEESHVILGPDFVTKYVGETGN
jgi:hypothetical protein